MDPMALIDDIEFFGRAVDAGEMTRDAATQALAEASNGGLTLYGAGTAIDGWVTIRAQLQRQHADTVDSLRALRNGKPIPEHVTRHLREDAQRMAWEQFPDT
jgi:hypothetical protein